MVRSWWNNKLGLLIAAATFLTSFFLLFSETNAFYNSLAGAILSMSLVWLAYIVIRLIMCSIQSG